MLADRFELRRRIGAGGMGEVYEAFDRETAEVIALKTLVRADGDTLTRFKREFRALQSTSHPNLVNLRELVRDGDHWFLTMELVRGSHFLEYVRGDVDKLRAALHQLVQALRVLHDGGLIHRDIKPSNVMVSNEGRVVLLDFGLVTALDPARQSVEGRAIGTVEYMAPEQAVGRSITEAADWYAVGVMLYEALTGDVPHTGHPLEILIAKQQSEPRAVEEIVPDAPGDLAALCRALLRIEPADRPTGTEIERRLGIQADAHRRTPVSRSSGGVFIGRERELAELAASFERARSEPVVHVIVGESGIGKSQLVARFTRMLQEDDPSLLILNGRCYERESVPYKALDGVADGIAHHLAQLSAEALRDVLPDNPSLLVRLFPVFVRIEAIAAAPVPREQAVEPQEQRRQMFGMLRQLLAAIASRRRVVIAIDDVQWADADSFLLLRELLRDAVAPNVLVLATARHVDDPDTMPVDGIVQELADTTILRTDLGRLTDEESRVLAERLAPALARRIDVARIAREAGGHPMFLAEILRHLDNLGDDTRTATLDAALTSRISLMRPDARGLLELVCIAGAPISLEAASSVCRLDGTALARAIASLRVASLAREVQRGRGHGLALEPYHDRVRESVVRRIPEPLLRDLHARLAMALESSGEQSNPQLLLRHFRLAELPERAARYAEEAALRSLAAHAFDQAARLWRIALTIKVRDTNDRRRLLLRLGEALVAAGRGAQAAEVYLEAAEGADRTTWLECHRHVAEQLLISGRIERGVEALHTLLSEIGVHAPPTPRRALVSLLRHRALLRLRGFRFKERHRTEISDAEILRLDVLQIAAKGLSVVDSIRGADYQTRELVLALRSGSRSHIAHAMALEAGYQATQGNFKRARYMHARAKEIAGDQHDPYVVGLLAATDGLLAYFSGDAPRTLVLMSVAEATLRRVPGASWELASSKLFYLFAVRMIGNYALMRERYRQYLVEAQQRGDHYVESTMRRVCVPMWLADDAPVEAARELERASWVPDAAGYHVQHFHELIARGEIALYAGEPADDAALREGSKRLASSLLLRITSIRIQHEYLLGRLALVGSRAATSVQRHAGVLAGFDNPVAQVWARVLRAGAALRGPDQGPSEALLTAAEQAAISAGMKLTAAAVRFRLAELRHDDALLAASSAEMTALGIRVPHKMAALLLPDRPW
jgi:tetratricopeptide (TPR) repeat protein